MELLPQYAESGYTRMSGHQIGIQALNIDWTRMAYTPLASEGSEHVTISGELSADGSVTIQEVAGNFFPHWFSVKTMQDELQEFYIKCALYSEYFRAYKDANKYKELSYTISNDRISISVSVKEVETPIKLIGTNI